MEIKRDTYLNRLINRKHNGFVKVITGIRRCGKSYLLNTLFYNHLIENGILEDHIITFAFDSAEDLIKIGENPLLLDNTKEERKADPKKFLEYLNLKIIDKEMYYLLLDEVQNLGAFESVLNGFLRKRNLDVYVTGSNSRFLSKDILTEFEGRGDEIHVLPLSFSEFFSVYDGSKEEAFDDYSVYGGLPAVALMVTEEQKVTYLTTQMNNLYLRDIINRYHLHEDCAIGELLDVISSGISTLTNPRKISATFASAKQTSISEVTVDKYIEHMEDAFMLSRAKRYDVKGRKYIGTPYKIYFEDIGLRNARLNFRQIEGTHTMENIIYNELRFRGYKVDVGVVESRERDETGKEIRKQLEIDFIATIGSKKYYLQSAYAIPDDEKYKQETKSFDKANDSFKKIILVEKSMKPRRDDNGYVMMGVKEFLLDAESMEA
ncbi:ATP-binding protein [Lachnotalea sp. AF33-28]|jgi:predicted AAA+ superfamily ATPase|uniref:ATP-binding protein n=1 Tax=Lachnotalea sp. AF33-28 TaxID=2292046 RepID=UPI000E47E61C|nr:ATP-binding protein [Lachnotalea sp. AF33-28]RHP35157.1 ATP-binding protein [Lachnotalea sp. AF33-28]